MPRCIRVKLLVFLTAEINWPDYCNQELLNLGGILQLARLDEDSEEAFSIVNAIKTSVSDPVFTQILAYVVRCPEWPLTQDITPALHGYGQGLYDPIKTVANPAVALNFCHFLTTATIQLFMFGSSACAGGPASVAQGVLKFQHQACRPRAKASP